VDTFVDFDLGLNTTIKKIRAALGDSADNPKFVETLPKRGYRFVCPVEEIAVDERAAAQKERKDELAADTITTLAASEAILATPPIPKLGRFQVALAMGALSIILLVGGFSWINHRNRLRQNAARQPIQSTTEERFENFGTRNPIALDAYRKGMNFLQDYDVPQQYDKAIEAFEQAVTADATFAAAYGQLSVAEWKKFQESGQAGLDESAEQDCNKSFSLNANQPATYICQGYIHLGRDNNAKQAVLDFSKAIGIDSHSPDADRERATAYRGSALAYQALSQLVDAEKDYQQAIQLAPHDWRGYYMLADLYSGDARYDEAIQQCEIARGITPNNKKVLTSLEANYLLAGQWNKAASSLEEAIKHKPTYGEYNDLAISYLNAGNFPKAIEAFQHTIDIDPRRYTAYGNLARAYFWAEKKDLASQNYLHAIDLALKSLSRHDDPGIFLMLAVYYAMLSRNDDALVYLPHAEQNDDPESAFWISVVYLQMDEQAQALAWLRKARERGYSLSEINAAPELNSLRANPEFLQIMTQKSKPNLSRRPQ
jgi:tetratricopeptide (TPR) repeat protein